MFVPVTGSRQFAAAPGRPRGMVRRRSRKDFPVGSVPDLPAAVFFDAYGTLISWRQERSPTEALAESLRKAGQALPFSTVERALQTEMAFYREHQARVRTAPELVELRHTSAAVLREGLGGEAACPLPLEQLLHMLLAAFETRALPDAAPAVRQLREAGVRTGVLSNFSYLLPLLLDEVGLAPSLDPVVFSAAAGVEKPEPAIFHAAARAVGAAPGDCVLLGDDLVNDVEGARAVGMPVIWIAREGAPPPAGVCAARSLIEAAGAVLGADWRRFSLPAG